MPRYNLFAARDGETLVESFDAPDTDAAMTEATRLAAERFQIEPDEELEAELDGFSLEELPRVTKDQLRDIYNKAKAERGNWLTKRGKMTRAGYMEAMMMLYGIDQGLCLAGHPDISHIVFLCSVRSPEEILA